jgi:hypothetical protein
MGEVSARVATRWTALCHAAHAERIAREHLVPFGFRSDPDPPGGAPGDRPGGARRRAAREVGPDGVRLLWIPPASLKAFARAKREALHAAARPGTVALALAASGLKGKTKLSFEGYRKGARASGTRLLTHQAGVDGRPIPAVIVRRIVGHPADYPVLSTWLNCMMHLTWIAGRNGTSPSPGRFDDYRHIIESATCGLFVSHDTTLLDVAPKLSPFRPPEGWGLWKARLVVPPGIP